MGNLFVRLAASILQIDLEQAVELRKGAHQSSLEKAAKVMEEGKWQQGKDGFALSPLHAQHPGCPTPVNASSSVSTGPAASSHADDSQDQRAMRDSLRGQVCWPCMAGS